MTTLDQAGSWAAVIRWSWGLKEEKIFDTKFEMNDFLKKMEEDIDSATCRYKSHKKNKCNLSKEKMDFYCTTRDWTDEEMDLYL